MISEITMSESAAWAGAAAMAAMKAEAPSVIAANTAVFR